MTNEQIAELKRIVDGAPDGATHYCSNSQYWRLIKDEWQVYEAHHGNYFWVDESPIYLEQIESLGSYRKIIAQHEEIERLRGGLNQAIELLVTALAEPEQITDSEIVQLRKIEKGESE